MAHFAQLDETNFVINVIVINNATIDNLPFPESEPVGVAFCQSLYGANTIWKQTSYNANFRVNYATVGGMYDPIKDMFIPVKPWEGCVWKPELNIWDCPKFPTNQSGA
jgi:hypothetical protein